MKTQLERTIGACKTYEDIRFRNDEKRSSIWWWFYLCELYC